MKNNYTLGLDIGIASVGWGIINNDDFSVVDCGVRLFNESRVDNNLKRRSSRSSRRLKRRRSLRIQELKEKLVELNIFDGDYLNVANVYEIRTKGLHNKLDNKELTAALMHICKHRGVSFDVVDDNEPSSDEEISNDSISNNDYELKKGKFICEIQLERLRNNGKVRGLTNNFRLNDYLKEVNQILSNQGLSKENNDEIIEIIKRQRKYYEGPGSEKSPTPYGRWFIENDEVVYMDLISKMKGRCSIYPDSFRAPALSFSAEKFNLLNDLNNLLIGDRKISQEEKIKAIEWVKENGNITPKQLAKNILEVNIDIISGFRIKNTDDSKKKDADNYLLTEFKGYKAIFKVFKKYEMDEICKQDEGLLDEIASILTDQKGIEERIKLLSKLDYRLHVNDDFIKDLANLPGFTKYHSLSFKAIYELLPDLIETNLNQMQILHSKGIFNINRKNHKGEKNITFDENSVLSPTAKRSMRQAIKVVNELREEFGEFEYIIIENTRDKNSDEQKKRIKDIQNSNALRNKQVEEEVFKAIGTKKGINSKLREKIRLYLDQDGKTGYTLEPIDLNKLIMDDTAYEVDHIIPISISFDDSFNNKILVSRKENQEKGNLTPLMAYDAGKFAGHDKEKYISYVYTLRKTKKISDKKTDYLLFKEDITKYDVIKKFINRNLVDTAYAARVVFNSLNDYFKDNEIETIVRTVRGGVTNSFRKKIKLDKDRDKDHSHHAIDALIIASLRKQQSVFKFLNKVEILEGNIIYDKETGEIIDIENDSEQKYFDSNFIKNIKNLSEIKVERYSWMVDRKINRQFSDETIYSTRNIDGDEYVIKKYKDIYDSGSNSSGKRIANDILDLDYQKYLMYKNDPQTFNQLIEIVEFYYKEYRDDEKIVKNGKFVANPFAMYKEENNMPIYKYSKKGNGPEIVSIKYKDGKLGNHVDITNKYNTKDKKVVLLQISPYRTDFYLTNDPKKKYKFVTIRYSSIRKVNNEYIIDNEWYENEKRRKGIKDTDKFAFSMHRNEIISITSLDKNKNVITNTYRFVGTVNDTTNRIELKNIDFISSERNIFTIGNSIVELKKLNVNSTGKLYKCEDEQLKLSFKDDNI